MTLIERVNRLIEGEGISARSFDEQIEKSDGYFRKQLRKGGSIGSEVLEAIHRCFPHWNLYWIITGEGDMISKKQAQLSQLAKSIEGSEGLLELIKAVEKENELLKKLLEVRDDLNRQLKKEISELKQTKTT